MSWSGRLAKRTEEARGDCAAVRAEFSAYLDGAVSGVEMAAISGHLESCRECAKDFRVWREVQRSLVELGSAQPPMGLQARLRRTLAAERERGTHLPLHRRMLSLWHASLAPLALRLSGGLAAAAILAGGLSWMFGAPVAVQANDDRMAHLVAPRYLGSNMPLDPITTRLDVPIVVEAMVDSNGRVYDYTFVDGPKDAATRMRVESNLLSSVFQPATVFGVPVRGHLLVTYTGVSVRG
jgi:hypothetical protein